jgi:cytoskeletal protein CcmA (bactofilin family)
MALWKEANNSSKDPSTTATLDAPLKKEPEHGAEPAAIAATAATAGTAATPNRHAAPRDSRDYRDTRDAKESVIAGDITITGKIDGRGHVRLAGRFEGVVIIEGNLTIDAGAKLTGSVRAKSVTIGGEVEGNIESAESVELLATGVLTGDLKGGTLTVASGSRMRGRVEFGWHDEASAKSSLTLGARQAS